MVTKSRIRQALRTEGVYRAADALFGPLERRELGQNRNLALIPGARGRKGGTHTISEWAFTIGLFQSVVHQAVGHRDRMDALDVGCGTGRLSLALAPLIGPNGTYTGVDVNADDIRFCRKHYTDSRAKFLHLDHSNRMYAKGQQQAYPSYPFDNECFDVVTALSVWTHLNEADARFYLGEVSRVLRPGGRAAITFFVLDDDYRRFLEGPVNSSSPFSFRSPDQYRFEHSVDGSSNWFCPLWAAQVPEQAIGITSAGINSLIEGARLSVVSQHRGQWKGAPGLFFQDVMILEKI